MIKNLWGWPCAILVSLALYGAWRAWWTQDAHLWPIVALLLFFSHIVRRTPQ